MIHTTARQRSRALVPSTRTGRSTARARRGRSPLAWVGLLVVIVSLLSPAQADDSISQLAKDVRSNEELYRDLECVIRKTYRIGTAKYWSPLPAPSVAEGSVRLVRSRGMIFFSDSEPARRPGGVPDHTETVLGYDGKLTRVAEKSLGDEGGRRRTLAWEYDEQWEHAQLRKLEARLWNRSLIMFPLSIYLGGDSQIKKQEGYTTWNTRTRIEGREVVDDQSCVKVRSEIGTDGSPKDGLIYLLWLAPDRNYLPLRTEAYRPLVNANLPVEIGRIEELRELAPGIWLPFRVSLAIYDQASLLDQRSVVATFEELTVEKAALNPEYETNLFRDVLPIGTHVYVVRDGKIRERRFHTGNVLTSPEPSRRWWFLVSVHAVLVVGLLLLFRRHRAGQLAARLPTSRARH